MGSQNFLGNPCIRLCNDNQKLRNFMFSSHVTPQFVIKSAGHQSPVVPKGLTLCETIMIET